MMRGITHEEGLRAEDLLEVERTIAELRDRAEEDEEEEGKEENEEVKKVKEEQPEEVKAKEEPSEERE